MTGVPNAQTDAARLSNGGSSSDGQTSDMPVGGYSVLSTTFVAGFVGSVVAASAPAAACPSATTPGT